MQREQECAGVAGCDQGAGKTPASLSETLRDDVAAAAARAGGGPPLGEQAPDFGAKVGNASVTLRDFRGRWVILFTHPEDLFPMFSMRTVPYLLFKKRIKAIALVRGGAGEPCPVRKRLGDTLFRNPLAIVDDRDGEIGMCYGVSADNGEMKGLFVIDPKGILRAKLSTAVEAVRSLQDILKLVGTFQAADRRKQHRPASDIAIGDLRVVPVLGTRPQEG